MKKPKAESDDIYWWQRSNRTCNKTGDLLDELTPEPEPQKEAEPPSAEGLERCRELKQQLKGVKK